MASDQETSRSPRGLALGSSATGAGQPAEEAPLIRETLNQARVAQRRSKTWIVSLRMLLVCAVLGLWEFSSGPLLDPRFFSSPMAIVQALYQGIAQGTLLGHAATTVQEAVAGYLIGTTIAILMALLVCAFQRIHQVIQPFVLAIYGIPRLALAPIFIVWFGIGVTSKIVISAFIVFFVTFTNTVAGLTSTPSTLVQISRMMGAGRASIVFKVMLPSATPFIMTALKIVLPLSVVGAIIGEFVSAQQGLGFVIRDATLSFDMARTFAAITFIMATVGVMYRLTVLIDQKTMKWRQDMGSEKI